MYLPLLRYIANSFENESLKDVAIIGAQHLLGTTVDLFRYLFSKGLKAKNIFLIGKCYSSSSIAVKEMEDLGIYTCPSSLSFQSHRSFDHQYRKNIRAFLKKVLPLVKHCRKIVLLDDGGILIREAHKMLLDQNKFYGVEQTSSGYNALKEFPLKFPVVNVARSEAKLSYESPMIADAISTHLSKTLVNSSFEQKKILIIGRGAIGDSLYHKLKNRCKVDIFDTESSLSSFPKKDFLTLLSDSDLIIGCTGTKSLKTKYYKHLKHGVVLASASSSDREFSAATLFRKQIAVYADPHRPIQVAGITLLNSGFPVNFDGKKHSVPPRSIQLTRALLAAGILQVISEEIDEVGLIPLDYELQRNILGKFFELSGNRKPPMNRGVSVPKNSLLSQTSS